LGKVEDLRPNAMAGTDQKNRASFDRKGGASVARCEVGLRPARTTNDLRTQCFFASSGRLSQIVAFGQITWRLRLIGGAPNAGVVGQATAEELVRGSIAVATG